MFCMLLVPEAEEPIAIPVSAGVDDAAALLSAGFELQAPSRRITARGRAIAKSLVIGVFRLEVVAPAIAESLFDFELMVGKAMAIKSPAQIQREAALRFKS